MRQRRAFTLVELLVVIGIIAVLIAILLPVLTRAQRQARLTACLSNERQLLLAVTMYAQDNKGYFPGGSGYAYRNNAGPFFFGHLSWYNSTDARNPYSVNGDERRGPTFLSKYVTGSKQIAWCPGDPQAVEEPGWNPTDKTTSYWWPMSLVVSPKDIWIGLFPDVGEVQKLTKVRYPTQKVVIIEWRTWHDKYPATVNLLPSGQDSTGKKNLRRVNAGFADGHVATRYTYEMFRTDVNWTGALSPNKEAGILGRDFQ